MSERPSVPAFRLELSLSSELSTSINRSWFGRGCDAISCNLADKRSVLASDAGPNTVARNFALFRFLVLARRPFAILLPRLRRSYAADAQEPFENSAARMEGRRFSGHKSVLMWGEVEILTCFAEMFRRHKLPVSVGAEPTPYYDLLFS